jgi:hypothetical protein
MDQYYSALDYYFIIMGQMITFYQSIFTGGMLYSLFIFVVGVIFATEFGKMTKKTFKEAGADKFMDKVGLKGFLKKGGFTITLSGVAGWIVKWFILLFFITVAVESLDLPQVSNFLFSILGYLPSLIGGLAILTIGAIVAQMIYEALEGARQASGMHIYHLAAVVAKMLVMLITFLVVLEQIGVQTTILQIFAGGLSLMVALAGGLAFGLGGQGHAKELLDEMKNKLKQ